MGLAPPPTPAPIPPDWKKDEGLNVPALNGAVDADAPPTPGMEALAEVAGTEARAAGLCNGAAKVWEMFAADRGAPNPPPRGPITLLNSAMAL